MNHTIRSFLRTAALVAVLGFASCQRQNPVASTPEGGNLVPQAKTVPDVPDTLAVPAGNALRFAASAEGVQIYQVQLTGSGYAWVFIAPDATLYEGKGEVGTHFAGPTWQTTSGSRVVGAKVSSAPSPNPNSIPMLLLRAVSSQGPGVLDSVTYIQRLNTVGGVAPSTGADADHVGEFTRVPYTAEYYFYAKEE